VKYSIQILFFLFFLIFIGCQKNTTLYETPIIINDQVFTLLENSPVYTVVGTIKVNNESNSPLNYFLVLGENSNAFEMETSTGRLILIDSSRINYQTNKQFNLEVMVGYESSIKSYGVFANVLVKIEDHLDPYTWTYNFASDKTQDAVVNSSQPNSILDQSEFFFATAWTNGLHPYIIRSFLQFDLTSIPSDIIVTDASLSLFNPKDGDVNHEHSCFSGSNAFCIRRVTSQWNSQSLTWNNQPAYSLEGEVILPECQSVKQDFENIDITELIKYMIQYPDKNYGFIIMLNDEDYYRRLCFASLENPNEYLRPKFVINYLR
jgi:hypothetical protein